MPLGRIERARRSLPEGYQYGDAGRTIWLTETGTSKVFFIEDYDYLGHWRICRYWNDIERGEH